MVHKLKTLTPVSLFRNPVVRWWIVGIFFMVMNLPLLYGLRDGLGLPIAIATVTASEINTILRFFVNDRWVFGQPHPTWKRLWQYHLANASTFVIWNVATNFFAYLQIHYLIASILGTCVSVSWSMLTNFVWIWRHPQTSRETPEQ